MKQRLVMSELLIMVLNLLDGDDDKMSLINALIDYGKGKAVDTSGMYLKVKQAFEYLTNPQRIDQIYTDDLLIFN